MTCRNTNKRYISQHVAAFEEKKGDKKQAYEKMIGEINTWSLIYPHIDVK